MAKLATNQQLVEVFCLIFVLFHITLAIDTASLNVSTRIRPISGSNEDYDLDTNIDNFGNEDGMKHILKDNGMLQLVLHEFAVNLIEKLQAEDSTKLHDRQVEIIQEDILDFYNKILGHPALNNDRVIFAQTKPEFRSILPPSVTDVEESKNKRKKRSGHLKEICNSVSSWKELGSGETRSQKTVRLLGDQFFYVTECTEPSSRCANISPLYSSKCWQKSSWNIAYVWSASSNRYIWDWIAVNTCCSCAAAKEN
ncbi:uncharacterized protein [Antedon mediterranea]|uniref:uncharacterized protein n=1 Tax=Antedon mediterranea TaxID=105859 RepID=UPI003AF4F83D